MTVDKPVVAKLTIAYVMKVLVGFFVVIGVVCGAAYVIAAICNYFR